MQIRIYFDFLVIFGDICPVVICNILNDLPTFLLAVKDCDRTSDGIPAVADAADELEPIGQVVRDARFPCNSGTVDNNAIVLPFIPKNIENTLNELLV